VIISITFWTFFGIAVTNEVGSATQVLSISPGAVDVRTMINPNTEMPQDVEPRFVEVVILANLPQLVLSAVYTAINRVITTFALSRETQRFSIRPKGLRVSSAPYGSQRSEYFLQLPYRIALPVMLFSVILHWLCSQGFFLVSILEGYSDVLPSDTGGVVYKSKENITWGYSPQAILILGVLGSLMYALLIGASLRRLTSAMPVFGSCSVVISAMCHQPAEEDGNEAVLRPLMWGVSSEEEMLSQEAQGAVSVVKTSFSSKDMRQPVSGDLVIMLAHMEGTDPPLAGPATNSSKPVQLLVRYS
jgi:hypothetical protein